MIEVDFVAISALVGTFLPLLISALKQSTWPNQTKKLFAAVLALVAAVIATGVQEGWSGLSWDLLIASFGGIYTLAQATYLGFWEDNVVEVRLSNVFNRAA